MVSDTLRKHNVLAVKTVFETCQNLKKIFGPAGLKKGKCFINSAGEVSRQSSSGVSLNRKEKVFLLFLRLAAISASVCLMEEVL